MMNFIYFLITGNCNLQCRYCFQDKKPDPGQERKATKEVIDALARYCRENQITNVELFGGEPLLYRDLFRYTVSRLKRISPDIQIGMITNGTLIDKEILDLIKEQNISVILSFDGDKETHDSMRGGFDNIMSWIPQFNNKSRIRVSLQAARVKGLYKNIRYIWDLDFADGVFVNVIQNYGWYDESDFAVFEQEYEKAILGMLNGEGVLICALSTFDVIDQSLRKIMYCGISARGLAADWEGTLYPCQRAGEMGKEFAIGDLWNGIDQQKAEKLRADIYNTFSHSPSANRYMVASYCPVSLYKEHHSFSGEWSEGCCRILDIKAKLVAKYYYEIKKYFDENRNIIAPDSSHPGDIPLSEIIHE
jgi:uncharacterized protein